MKFNCLKKYIAQSPVTHSKSSQMKIICFLVLNISFVTLLYAQDDCSCCTENHRQFDFWLGEWEVMNSEGNKVGENSISKMEGDCILVEKWQGAQGLNGTSHNYYDPSDKSWNQLWLDNRGGILKLKGALESGQMVMRSALAEDTEGNSSYNQISWRLNDDGTVTQLWELYNDEGKLIRQLFLGIYHKKS